MLIGKFLSKLKPPTLIIVLALITALRWVYIADGYDFGWEFETGYRVFSGQHYGIDFYTALGPLSYEIVGFVFKFFGAKWIYVYLISYSAWLLTLLGVYQLLKNISSDTTQLTLAMILVMPLSIPHLVALHNYNFLSYLLAIWSGVLFFKYLNSEKYLWLLLAGLLSALTLFTKQNIGIGVLLLIVSMLVLSPCLNPSLSIRKTFLGFIFFVGAFSAITGFLFYVYSKPVGFNELWRLMFKDAAEAKGNSLNIIKTAIPRMTFGTSEKHDFKWLLQHLAEFLFFLVAVTINLLLYKQLLFQKLNSEKKETGRFTNRALIGLCAVFIFVMSVPLMVPSAVFLVREKYYWFEQQYHLSQLVLVFFSWIVLIGEGFYLFWLFKKENWRDNYKKILLLIFSVGLGFFVCSSRFTYLFLTLALFAGYFFTSTLSLGLWSRKSIVLVALLLWVGIYFYYPTHALGPQVRLEGSQLGGLWFGENDRSFVELYTQKLKPYVNGKRTLWLSMGGPHSLSGSVPVRNISNLYFDQFNSRIEESLVKDWMVNPPEMIVRYWYALPGNSVWLKSELFESWIKKNYVQLTEIEGRKVLKYRF